MWKSVTERAGAPAVFVVKAHIALKAEDVIGAFGCLCYLKSRNCQQGKKENCELHFSLLSCFQNGFVLVDGWT